MIYFGCTILAILIAGFFYTRRPAQNPELEDGKSTIDKWITKNAAHLARAIATLFVLFWIYGLYSYPDAPIISCGEGYCGKHGLPHTPQEYHAYQNLASLTFFVFVLCCPIWLYLRAKIPRDHKSWWRIRYPIRKWTDSFGKRDQSSN